MAAKMRLLWSGLFLLAFLLFPSRAVFAQFTSNIQGSVEDPSGAEVAGATVTLTNNATGVASTTVSDSSGNYRFISLAPGAYKMSVEAKGFKKWSQEVTLLTEQNVSLPVKLAVGTATEAVTVTAEVPVVDTADSRNELTLQNTGVAQLPVAEIGRAHV